MKERLRIQGLRKRWILNSVGPVILILVLAAIVSGAAFGAHVCFYCDVTVFTSGMTKIDNIEHAVTQLPYGLIGMAVSCAGYLLAGFLLR